MTTVVLNIFNNSAAANIVLSFIVIAGTVQCVEKSFVWLEILVALVALTKWKPYR